MYLQMFRQTVTGCLKRQGGYELAERRMFSKKIIDSDSFLDMPLSTQALYFHLAMRADDDGFLNNARKIMKIVGASQADYDRLVDKAVASLSTNGKPLDTHMDTVGIPDDNQMDTAGYTNDNQMSTWLTQDRIGKDRIGKESIKKYICPEPGKPAPDCSDIFLPLVDGTFYSVPWDRINNWSKAFPAVDVEHELRKMLTWLDSNPKKQKTARGINRFINGWLSRTQDNGGTGHFIEENRTLTKTKDGRILQ